MSPEEFSNRLMAAIPEIKSYVSSVFPRHAAKIAVDHFKNNFRKGGFVNGGLRSWPKAKRQTNADGKGAEANYGTLLSGRDELFNSIVGEARNGMAIIKSDKPYAEIQNNGGTINHPGGTAYFPKANKAVFVSNETASRYDALHIKPLNRTRPHPITIPARPFIGESIELTNDLTEQIEKDFLRILNID